MTAKNNRYHTYAAPQSPGQKTYAAPQSPDQKTPGRSAKQTPKYKAVRTAKGMTHNEILGLFFAMGLFVLSLSINIFNVYQAFGPATSERFLASGIIDFVLTLPGFTLLAVGWRIAIAAVVILSLYKVKRVKTAIVNPVWVMYLFILGYCLFVGLSGTVTTIPFIIAAILVGLLQFVEVLFWTVDERHPVLWAATGIAYIVELSLQYQMLPVHSGYDSLWGLMAAMGSVGFDWSGFNLVQSVIALCGLLGIELGARLYFVIKEHA